jgi:alanyl-tRNA synthetase
MHYALREVLGKHVEQKGSLVSSDGLRFDFSHFQKVSDDEIVRVEQLVNRLIRKNSPLNERRAIPVDEARKLGAMALFGEKYGDRVRVIQLGDSVELCGGTHVAATGQIGFFKIISESAVSAGVRRIEASTGEGVEKMIYHALGMLREAAAFFNNTPDIKAAIRRTLAENTELQKQVTVFMREQIASLKTTLLSRAEQRKGYRLVTLQKDLLPDAVKELAMQLRSEPDLAFAAAYVHGGKPMLALALGDELVQRGMNAATLVREAAKRMGGSGGGQPFFATAGGKNVDDLQTALQALKDLCDGQQGVR